MDDTPVRISRPRQSQSRKTKHVFPGSLKSARCPEAPVTQTEPEQDEPKQLVTPAVKEYCACPFPPPGPGPRPGPMPPPGPPGPHIPMCGPTSTLVLQTLKIIEGTDISVEEGYDHGLKTYKISSNPIEVKKEIEKLRDELHTETGERITADEELNGRLTEEAATREAEDARLQELIETHPSYLIVDTDDEGYPDVSEPSEIYLYLTKIHEHKVDNYREWIWQNGEWECIGETSVDPYSADESRGIHLDDDTLEFSMKLKTTEQGEIDTEHGGLNFDESGNLYNSNMSRPCTDDEMEDWLSYDYLVDPPANETGNNDEAEDTGNG